MIQRYSIIQNSMSNCFVCGTNKNIHIHEIFYGTAHRQLSIKYGLCIGLCATHHNMSDKGIHYDKQLDLRIKQMAQQECMQHYNLSMDQWLKIFRRNYL